MGKSASHLLRTGCTVSLLAALLASASCRTNQPPRRQLDDAAITAKLKQEMAEQIGLFPAWRMSRSTPPTAL